MTPTPQLEFSQGLRVVVTQFKSFLSNPENAKLIAPEDFPELAGLVIEIAVLDGDVNRLLKYSAEVSVRMGWFFSKYEGILVHVSRDCTTHFNLMYSKDRERGYGEWDAKRRCESDGEYLKAVIHRDRLQVLVNILKMLVEVCRDRLQALQQIANNYRADIRDSKATL